MQITTFQKVLKRILDETGLKPELLELEITENCITEDPRNSMEIIRKLKTLEIKISIDDFGSGYSRLIDLQLYPIDSLKCDPSFVKKLSNEGDNEVFQAIVNLGHALKVKVIARRRRDKTTNPHVERFEM